MNVVDELIRVARKLMFDAEHLFILDESDDRLINAITLKMNEVVDNLADRNKVEYRLGTRVNGRALELSIGVDDHPNKDKMLHAVERAAKIVGREFKVRVI